MLTTVLEALLDADRGELLTPGCHIFIGDSSTERDVKHHQLLAIGQHSEKYTHKSCCPVQPNNGFSLFTLSQTVSLLSGDYILVLLVMG